ncbi:hypothetical protein ACN5LI_001833 [Cronobacter turicensis]
MGISQNFKSTVTFGGRVDPSFRRSTEDLQSAIKDTGQTVATLTRRQEKLSAQIKRMKLSGQEVSHLTSQYQRLGREIESVTHDQDKLNRQMKRGERLASFGRGAAGAAKFGAIGAGGLFVGLAAGALEALSSTTEKLSLARGYGVGIGQYSAWDNIAQRANLNGENVGDLAEELTNKIGEQGNAKTLDPMLNQLNLSKSRMAKWSRERQFNEVMNRLTQLKDDRRAASLADQLMGGEGNKLLTMIRMTGKSWYEIMTEAKKTNLLTQEGAEGAARAHFAMSSLWSTATSGFGDVIGKIGGELEPDINRARESLVSWFKDNENSITETVKGWIRPDETGKTGLQRLGDNLASFGEGVVKVSKVLWAVADKFSWILPETGEDKAEKLKKSVVSGGVPLEYAQMFAKENGFEKEWNALGITAKNLEELRKQPVQLPDSMMDYSLLDWKDYLVQKFSSPQQAPTQQTNHTTITVNAAPGQDPQQVGQAVYDKFQNSLPKWTGNGAMYDAPGS